MKRIHFILFILFIQLSYSIFAQTNLVPNPDFEQYDTCPYNLGQICFATPWFQPNKVWSNPCNNSSDYYNQCASIPNVTVPSNGQGYQQAKSGVAYAGIVTFAPTTNYREYIETKLNNPLIANKKYCVEFYVSLADFSMYAMDAIGIYFSNDSIIYSDINFSNLPFIPQIVNPINNILSDTANWTLISGTYMAVGLEQFITIGNFNDTSNVNVTITGGSSTVAYYYIDDVSIYLCDSTPQPPQETQETTFFLPNAFSPNGDGDNDLFFVRGDLAELHCEIFNRWGEKVFEYEGPEMNSGQGWDGTINGQQCPTGVYVYSLTAKDKKGNKIERQGNVSILR